MEVSGEAADLVMKEGIQISEEAIKLLARGAKNLAALLYALAKDQKKLYGKVNMNRLLVNSGPLKFSLYAQRILASSSSVPKKSVCCSRLSWTRKAMHRTSRF